MMDNYEFITKAFLESITGLEISSFRVTPGSSMGDNYQSAMYSISAEANTLSPEENDVRQYHYMLKCYPSHPSSQKILNKRNLFHKELTFYESMAKDFEAFQNRFSHFHKDQCAPLAIPKVFGGKAINYAALENIGDDTVCSPLDNFILMTDLKKHGFEMADVTLGLDFEHVKLAFIELARLHAISWAYREKLECNLQEKYPILKRSVDRNKGGVWLGVLADSVGSAEAAIDSCHGKGNSFSKSLRKFQENTSIILEYFNTGDETLEEEMKQLIKAQHELPVKIPPWRVICHGDMWCNNLLYKHNEGDKRPVQVVLLDFQGVRMACPTVDLACLLYTSTRREMRERHMSEWLQIYHDTFTLICNQLEVDLLPGFCVEVLKEKLHVSKLVGFLIAVISLPMNFVGKGERDGEDEVKELGESMAVEENILQQACISGARSKLYQEWIVELVREMCDVGVI